MVRFTNLQQYISLDPKGTNRWVCVFEDTWVYSQNPGSEDDEFRVADSFATKHIQAHYKKIRADAAKAKKKAEDEAAKAEKARKKADEAAAKKAAQEQAKREAEERTKREREDRYRRFTEEKSRKEAEEKAKRDAEERAKKNVRMPIDLPTCQD